MSEQLVDAEVVEPGTELEPADSAPPANLFRTTDPAEVLAKAEATAGALMPVVRRQGLVVNIQGREHLRVEAWTTLGAMLGVTPVCEWTRKLENGWEARVEARTLDGRIVGAAEAECLRSEKQWSQRDDYALRSMAQTRATSKALASVLRFVATLGGASGTPAEEMPSGSAAGARSTENSNRSESDFATDRQRQFVHNLLGKLSEEQRVAITGWIGEKLRKREASWLIEKLKDGTEAGRVEVLTECGFFGSDVPADTEGL